MAVREGIGRAYPSKFDNLQLMAVPGQKAIQARQAWQPVDAEIRMKKNNSYTFPFRLKVR